MKLFPAVLVLCLSAAMWGQANTEQPAEQNPPPPRSDSQPQIGDEGSGGEDQRESLPSNAETPHSASDSSSRSNLMDLSPPIGDAQQHPSSDTLQGVNKLQPWNPHRAEKDVEVGDYYFKEGNYRGAEGRYRDALIYKPDDAIATYRLAEVMQKTDRPEEAREFYLAYLKILPHGPKAEEARKALEKLRAAGPK